MRTWLRARRRDATVLWHRLQPGPHALILAYHRVIELPTDPYHLCTAPALFRRHLELLGDRVRPLAEVVRGAPGVALTFDDGYADSLETVAPLLGSTPATFFVTGHPTDREFWWNELEQLHLTAPTAWRISTEAPRTAQERALWADYRRQRRLPQPLPVRVTHRLMTHDELRRLAEKFEIGAHTLTHPRLNQLSQTQQGREIEGSRRHLEGLLQRPVTAFAYPYGVYDSATVSLARDSFTHACTIAPGLVTPGTDRFLLPRVHADSLAPAALQALLELLPKI